MFVLRAKFAVIDVRGSNGRGWKYRSAFYGALGTVEIDDQIVTIRNVLKKYPFLDARRLFVFGWSYGGFAAASIVERAPEAFFKCAISVAPVANFLYYETSYTERFMGDAGEAAYDASDITTNVSNFKTTRLLLIHGLYDDCRQFQQNHREKQSGMTTATEVNAGYTTDNVFFWCAIYDTIKVAMLGIIVTRTANYC
ncbi:peptidase, S9A/B/C family, catalytic domain protein [Ancylostoma ceylanicum]|uniref:Peptidase, S9A/B/C family, catalytic domain protein n=1 Tax=Ancylostoma ceylanicum TaxID=53326 RepID=A0A0D6LW57_9BILA|nr:peptidase, S9A/B/C family, catalytic domain protein [Ancylostoma ceylanicum]